MCPIAVHQCVVGCIKVVGLEICDDSLRVDLWCDLRGV
jgi:hypothetical protein